jgi:hypothetical protein
MMTTCGDCGKTYDDFDHTTICPHARFVKSESVDQLQKEGKLRPDSGPEGDPK